MFSPYVAEETLPNTVKQPSTTTTTYQPNTVTSIEISAPPVQPPIMTTEQPAGPNQSVNPPSIYRVPTPKVATLRRSLSLQTPPPPAQPQSPYMPIDRPITFSRDFGARLQHRERFDNREHPTHYSPTPRPDTPDNFSALPSPQLRLPSPLRYLAYNRQPPDLWWEARTQRQ